jgi:hypothetical protein
MGQFHFELYYRHIAKVFNQGRSPGLEKLENST